MSALRTAGLSRHFGGLVALDDVSLELAAGARHALIGPNGAGKTTLVNLLSGALAPTAGEIFLGGAPVTHLAQHQRVRRGLARTFQVSSLFPGLTAYESVLLATQQHGGDEAGARALLEGLNLAADAHRVTTELAYGRQRLLEIALALACRPRVLLLDEPAAGIGVEESAQVLEVVARLPTETAVLLIEHDMDLVFRFAQRVTVLVQGRVLAEGSPEEIAADAQVRNAYLGGGDG